MKIIILGAAGFIGTNLSIRLAENSENKIVAVDKYMKYFSHMERFHFANVRFVESSLDEFEDFSILEGQDVVYHLVSTNAPTSSNLHISQDIQENVLFSSKLFEACVKYGIKKVVFISSGGTVYGKDAKCPLSETLPTRPISSYGLQKATIENMLYLYNYMYKIDYKIVRLSNPYGPYQRPNGILGAVTTFVYKALKGEEIQVYGDGSVVRDFIYIDDAISGIINIANGDTEYHTFNLGCGHGTSINEMIQSIEKALGIKVRVNYKDARTVDVPVNYLDVSRYEACFGSLEPIALEDGIRKTAEFIKRELLH